MLESQSSDKFEMYNILKVIIVIFSIHLIYDYYLLTTHAITRVQDPKFKLLSPYNNTAYEIDDVYNQLIDLKDFSFKINPQSCQNYSAGLLLVIIISSSLHNYDKRTLIRNTWGRSTDSTKVLFLLGEPNNITVSKKIDKESRRYGDIVQGNFIDAYRNMTYKHVMGLKWVSRYCPMAKYVLKTDDDVLVNMNALRLFLTKELSPWGAEGLITCQVLENALVQRSKHDKWRVSFTEYSGKYYPNYCAGWVIIYSQDVVHQLLSQAQKIPYFWIDDVHLTGVVASQINIARTPLNSLILTEKRSNYLAKQGPQYAGQFLFGPPDLNIKNISKLWKAIYT